MKLALLLLAAILPLNAQKVDSLEGIWQGYDGEWGHVTRQVVALARSFPAEKLAWRPQPGVRSAAEVFNHIAVANYELLSIADPSVKVPPALHAEDAETAISAKEDVVKWLEQSFEAVRLARQKVTPRMLSRKVKIHQRDSTVDGMYLRIIVHANEHMGQLIAYARMNGITPPWS